MPPTLSGTKRSFQTSGGGSSLKKQRIQSGQGGQKKFKRPPFSLAKKESSRLEATIASGIDLLSADLTQLDLAAPHRVPYKVLRDIVFSDDKQEIQNLVRVLCDVSKKIEAAFANVKSDSRFARLTALYRKTREDVEQAHSEFVAGRSLDILQLRGQLVTALNNLASNAPGLGPHSTTNRPVSDRSHFNVIASVSKKGFQPPPLSPRSGPPLTIKKAGQIAVSGSNTPTPSGQLQPIVPELNNMIRIPVQTDSSRIFNGSLLVHQGLVYKPRQALKPFSRQFENDYELIP